MKGQTNQSVSSELLDTCPAALLTLDTNNVITGINPALLALTGTETGAWLNKSASELDPALAPLASAVGELAWTAPDGSTRNLVVAQTDLGAGNNARWIEDLTALHRVIAERDHLQEELEAQLLTDTVTGLLNRRGVMLALEPQVARSRRYNSDMSVIMMDASCADDSDAFQVEVSRLLKDQLRWADVIGCTENREFILVLPETTRDDAMKLADKLAERLAELAETAHACYGVTQWQKTDNAGALLQRAAAALEQSRSEQNGIAVAL